MTSFLDGPFGVRGVGEVDAGAPRYREDATVLLQSLLAMLRARVNARREFERAGARAQLWFDEACEGVGPLRRMALRACWRRARALVGMRELPKFRNVLGYAAIRAKALEVLGGRAAHLPLMTIEEVRRGVALSPAQVAERSAAFDAERRRARLPTVLLTDGRFFFVGDVPSSRERQEEEDDEGGTVLRGVGVSAGVVEGIVHIVNDPAAATLDEDTVLVCAATDPSWTPLFLPIRALVTETGGTLTHGAVLCRELGKVGVVAIANATGVLREGERVRVDGNRGIVKRLG